MLTRLAVAVTLLLALSSSLAAQSSRGKDFWTGFMFNVFGDGVPVKISLYVSTRSAVTGLVTIPGIGWQKPFSIPANSGLLIDLPGDQLISEVSEARESKAVHLVASDTVDVFAMNYVTKSTDASPILATGALGTDYRVITYGPTSLGTRILPSQFMVIAAENGTEVEIVPSGFTLGGNIAGKPFRVTLDTGQIYQVQSQNDLTGSTVRSVNGKPFALLCGDASAAIPNGFLYVDHVYEQAYPLERWGMEFGVVPLATRKGGDTYRILAASNGTTVSIDGQAPFSLNAGEFRELLLSGPTRIHSTAPIVVAQFSNSSSFDLVEDADPFMLLLNPSDMRRRDLIFDAFQIPEISKHFVNIVIATAGVRWINLDGNPVGGSFTPFPTDPDYSYATIEVKGGSHTIYSPVGYIAYAYGFGEAESYGYSTGTVDLPCRAPTVTSVGKLDFCEGDSVELDGGADYLSYRWSTGDTTRSIVARAGGVYTVTTTDSGGCVQTSTPITVTVTPVPAGSIAVAGDTDLCPCDSIVLTAPQALNYRWTTGDTTRSIVVRSAGTYGVTSANNALCSVTLAPVTVRERLTGAVVVAAGADSAEPGGKVTFPIYMRSASGLAGCGAPEFAMTLRFNASLLHPDAIDGATVLHDEVVSGERRISLRGVRNGDTLLRLECTALLGDAESTPIAIDSFRWEGCSLIPTDTSAGRFVLTSLCRDGGPRLVTSGGAALKRSLPDPADASCTIEYTLAENGPTRLYLVDASGRYAGAIDDGDRAPGDYGVTVDLSSLPPGLYWCVLETPTQRISRAMHVVR
jgi:hypothetical protein